MSGHIDLAVVSLVVAECYVFAACIVTAFCMSLVAFGAASPPPLGRALTWTGWMAVGTFCGALLGALGGR